MNILLIEPYFTGSHSAWAKGFQKYSSHKVDILKMSGHYWKWRMHGGAVSLANKFLNGNYTPDLILATDMLDLTTFLALTKSKTFKTKTAIYFHENQLSYPWSPTDRDVANKRDVHYGFINYSSALAADKIFFNSNYHKDSFIDEVTKMLKGFPDNHELSSINIIKKKSSVLHLGMDLKKFKKYKPNHISKNRKPLILWNHRWEYDKNPKDFFDVLIQLSNKGLKFEVAILGENFSQSPKEFQNAKKELGKKIIHFGYCKDFSAYAKWLWRSDIVPITSNQDFFGGSLVEAMYCNCYPIIPNRLAYPEHFPYQDRAIYIYNTQQELATKLESAIVNVEKTRTAKISNYVEKYDWNQLISRYDEEVQKI